MTVIVPFLKAGQNVCTIERGSLMKPKFLLGMTLLLSLGLLSGCQKAPAAETSNTENTDAKAVETVVLNIGTMPTQTASIYAIGIEKGLFEKHQLDVKLTVFNSAVERDAAATAGQLDGFLTDIIGLANLSENGYDFRGTSSEYENFSVLVSPNSKATSLSDLKDQKIGLSNNTVAEYMADTLMADSSFEKVNLPKVPERLAALMGDQVQAGVFPEPFTSIIKAQGGKALISSADANLQPVVFVFSGKLIDENTDAIKRFYAAYNEIIDYMKSADYSEYKDVLLTYKLVSPELADTLKLPIDQYGPAKTVPQNEVESLLKWMTNKGMKTDGLTYEKLVDQQVISK